MLQYRKKYNKGDDLVKKVALLIASVTVLLGMSLGKEVKAYNEVANPKTISFSQTKEDHVKKILQGYFENKWEEEKQGIVIENKYIMPNSLQMIYDNLQSELNYKWCKGIKESIEWYNVDVNVNSIKIVDDLLELDVNNKVTFKYKDAEETSSLDEHHIVYLNNKSENVLVERDIYNDLLSDESTIDIEKNFSNKQEFEQYINEKISEVISNLKTVNDDIEKYKCDMQKNVQDNHNQIQGISGMQNRELYGGYNGSTAASWARSHVNDSEDYSVDCTNFVSKALRAGGFPTDGTWYYHSNAWIRVIELRNWLLNRGYASESVGMAYGKKGDVIQLYNASRGEWRHSVIITYVNDRYGNVYVTAHSNRADNVSIRNYYPSSTYSNARTLRLS